MPEPLERAMEAVPLFTLLHNKLLVEETVPVKGTKGKKVVVGVNTQPVPASKNVRV